MQCLQADLDHVFANIDGQRECSLLGLFCNMSYVRVGAAPHPQSSLFPPFSQDCLFPGRPGNCQRVSRGTSAQKPGKVLSANSSSVNIRPVGVALLLFVDCTNYVHVLMGF